MENRMSETCCSWTERSANVVDANPISASMLALGVGFGLGVAVANVLVEGARSRRAPSSYAEKVGHSMLEAVLNAVPESLSKRVGR